MNSIFKYNIIIITIIIYLAGTINFRSNDFRQVWHLLNFFVSVINRNKPKLGRLKPFALKRFCLQNIHIDNSLKLRGSRIPNLPSRQKFHAYTYCKVVVQKEIHLLRHGGVDPPEVSTWQWVKIFPIICLPQTSLSQVVKWF